MVFARDGNFGPSSVYFAIFTYVECSFRRNFIDGIVCEIGRSVQGSFFILLHHGF